MTAETITISATCLECGTNLEGTYVNEYKAPDFKATEASEVWIPGTMVRVFRTHCPRCDSG